jgi:hypothetical protein
MATCSAPKEICPDQDSESQSFWDLPWLGFTVGALDFALDLRAAARKAAAGEGSKSQDPEQVMASKLKEFAALGEHFKLHRKEFSMGVANLEDFLRHHLEYGYEAPWKALLAGCEDLIQQLSATIRDAEVDFEIYRDQLEREGSTDPEILRAIEGLRGAGDRMRLLLLEADQPGEVGAA